jgi:hypothetical protein
MSRRVVQTLTAFFFGRQLHNCREAVERFAPTNVGDYIGVAADVSPRKLGFATFVGPMNPTLNFYAPMSIAV